MKARGESGTRSTMWKGLQPLLGLVIIYALFTAVTGTFRTFDTFKTILTQAVILGTLAAGPTVVLISGGLDLVGYGLDYADRYRTLPYVAELKKEVYSN